MKNNELFIGLDIGTTKIVAMIGHVNEYSKLKIIGLGRSESLGVHRGVVNNITPVSYTHLTLPTTPYV